MNLGLKFVFMYEIQQKTTELNRANHGDHSHMWWKWSSWGLPLGSNLINASFVPQSQLEELWVKYVCVCCPLSVVPLSVVLAFGDSANNVDHFYV